MSSSHPSSAPGVPHSGHSIPPDPFRTHPFRIYQSIQPSHYRAIPPSPPVLPACTLPPSRLHPLPPSPPSNRFCWIGERNWVVQYEGLVGEVRGICHAGLCVVLGAMVAGYRNWGINHDFSRKGCVEHVP